MPPRSPVPPTAGNVTGKVIARYVRASVGGDVTGTCGERQNFRKTYLAVVSSGTSRCSMTNPVFSNIASSSHE